MDLKEVLNQMKVMENNILSKIESTLDAKIAAITDSVMTHFEAVVDIISSSLGDTRNCILLQMKNFLMT